jgi:adenine phosphoribosyltransferase
MLDAIDRIKKHIRDIPDFPKPGILFKDITPLLRDAEAFHEVTTLLAELVSRLRPDVIVAIESRGFLFGAPLAARLGLGLVPVRKPGKLPYKTRRVEYALEYGSDSLEMHDDALHPGMRALVVDDVLATGGTAAATTRLIQGTGAEVVGCAFVIELGFLSGRDKLAPTHVESLIRY